ncbi:MAG: OadG-related small transporter subunit [bacterium]|nr:OadG-related small transporter subunit [bacterium]
MRFVFNPASLPETLLMTLKGMVGIFVVIGVIMLAIWVLNKIAKPKDNS